MDHGLEIAGIKKPYAHAFCFESENIEAVGKLKGAQKRFSDTTPPKRYFWTSPGVKEGGGYETPTPSAPKRHSIFHIEQAFHSNSSVYQPYIK